MHNRLLCCSVNGISISRFLSVSSCQRLRVSRDDIRGVTRITLKRCYTSVEHSGLRDTYPSSQKPISGKKHKASDGDGDRGYLAFTKASLFKLTLPLSPPEPTSKSEGKNGGQNAEEKQSDTTQPVQSVVFLLHSGQPLSYIESLIRAEGPSPVASGSKPDTQNLQNQPMPISFHTSPNPHKRWSASTGIGDFLREAARPSHSHSDKSFGFTIRIGARAINVNVPSFEERTKFLRRDLRRKVAEVGRLAKLKDECDALARSVTQRVAVGVAGVMGAWWVSVGYLTFRTSLGWDTMEPITYLTGLGTVISGYVWFLWHNREVSYRTVLTETTSRRRHRLYIERGFDEERYRDLVDDVKEIRRVIRRVAKEYELEWDDIEKKEQGVEDEKEVEEEEEENTSLSEESHQSHSESENGPQSPEQKLQSERKRALEIITNEEEIEKEDDEHRRKIRSKSEADGRRDDDADGRVDSEQDEERVGQMDVSSSTLSTRARTKT